MVQAGISSTLASLPDGKRNEMRDFFRHLDVGAKALGQRVDQRLVAQQPVDVVGGDDAERHAIADPIDAQAAGGTMKGGAASRGAGTERRGSAASSLARRSRASASARRARARHLCCLSQAAMPPASTPTPTSTKIRT